MANPIGKNDTATLFILYSQNKRQKKGFSWDKIKNVVQKSRVVYKNYESSNHGQHFYGEETKEE